MGLLRGVRPPASESDSQGKRGGALVSGDRRSQRAAADCNGVLVSLLLGLRATKTYLFASNDSSMSRIPAAAVIRWACWCLCLLFVAWAGSATPGAAEGRGVASSVIQPPLRVLDELLWPASTPESAPAVVPTPTPVPSPAPTATPTPRPAPAPAPQPTIYADAAAAAAVYALTNELRADNGLPALARQSALDTAADRYAATLAANDWFAHEGPDGSTLRSRAEAAGYVGWVYLAENLYRGFYGDSAESIVQAWTESPGHYSNMVGQQITEIGVACYVSGDTRWCVQDFGDR